MAFEGKNLIGVDIGTSAVKVIQLRETGKKVHLMKYGVEPLPPQSIVDGHVMNSAAVVDALQKIFKDLKISQRDIALSISGNSVIIKKLNLPLMKRDELEEQIQWEAEQHIPFEIADVEIDYNILSENIDANQMDVLLVAAKKEEIHDLVEVARQAKLKPGVVDIDAFALQNAYAFNYDVAKTETVALLNIGASLTTINVLYGEISQFTRDISNGGAVITEEIQKQLQVGYAEAESYKAGGFQSPEDAMPPKVDEIIMSVVDALAGEIQRSLDFYMATTSTGDIERILITGGTAKIPHLKTALERRARVAVEPLDPFRRVFYSETKFDPEVLNAQAHQAAISVGLALRKQKERIK